MTTRGNIFVTAVVLMLIALLLCGVFVVLSLDRSYREELLSRYHLPVQHLKVNLQRAAEYGVPLDRAVGVERDLKSTWDALERLVTPLDSGTAGHRTAALLVVDVQGRILHSVGGSVDVGSADFERALTLPNAPGEAASGTRFVEGVNTFLIPQRILDDRREWVASLIAVIDKSPVIAKLEGPRKRAISAMFLTFVLAVLLYAFTLTLVFEIYLVKGDRLLSRILWVSVVFGVTVMLASSYAAARPYQPLYSMSTAQKADVLVELVRGDTQKALARGTRMEFLDFSHYPWDDLLRNASEIGTLEVRDENRRAVVSVSRDGFVHLQNEKLRPLHTPDRALAPFDDLAVHATRIIVSGEHAATVLARVSGQGVRARVFDLAADGLAAIMVSVLIFVELFLLFYFLASSRRRPETVSSADRASALMRPAAFLFLFGIDFSMSFVPLYTERLYVPLLGIPREVVIGLPISVEFLFVGIAMLAAGAWIDRVGWRRPFLAGTALAALGAIYSWAAPDLLQFIAARAVLGVGYGLTLMACQSYVIGIADSRSTASGLAKLFAGVYGGSICGGVAGAILAEHFGFAPVFFAGGVIVLTVLLYAVVMLPSRSFKPEPEPEVGAARAIERVAGSGTARLGRFLTNRSMLGLMLFSSLPASVAAVGFLNYFSPIYLNRIGTSQSTIGQILMLYGVCLVFFAPWVSRCMDTVERKRLSVIIGCVVGGIAFLGFHLLDGVMAAAVAVVLLGVSHSLVLSSQSAYALALKVSRELGKGKAISVFRASGRLGQMLGPVAFGAVALAGSVNSGIVYMGYAYLVMALAFYLCTRRDGPLLVEGE